MVTTNVDYDSIDYAATSRMVPPRPSQFVHLVQDKIDCSLKIKGLLRHGNATVLLGI